MKEAGFSVSDFDDETAAWARADQLWEQNKTDFAGEHGGQTIAHSDPALVRFEYILSHGKKGLGQ